MAKKNGRPRMVIPDAIRQAVIELHAQEVGKNEIERRLKSNGLTRYMLDTIAKEEGLLWDRTKTQKANEVLRTKGSAQRAVMADRFIRKASELLDKLDQPYELQMLSNRTGEWVSYQRSEPPAEAVQKYVEAADRSMKRHQELISFDQEDESEEAKSLLGDLQNALKKYSNTNKDQDQTPEEVDSEED